MTYQKENQDLWQEIILKLCRKEEKNQVDNQLPSTTVWYYFMKDKVLSNISLFCFPGCRKLQLRGIWLQQFSWWHSQKSSFASLSEYDNNNNNKTPTSDDTSKAKFMWTYLRTVLFVFKKVAFWWLRTDAKLRYGKLSTWQYVHERYRKINTSLELLCTSYPIGDDVPREKSICIMHFAILMPE